jgi:hypothetical protein
VPPYHTWDSYTTGTQGSAIYSLVSSQTGNRTWGTRVACCRWLKVFCRSSLLVSVVMADAMGQAEGIARPLPFDKGPVESYLRHLIGVPSVVPVRIAEAEPAAAGFYRVKVDVGAGDREQQELFYVSADRQVLVHGSIFDLRGDPFAKELSGIRLADQPFRGSGPHARVTIVEFADFQCPYCRAEASVLKDNVLHKYSGQVRVYFIDSPSKRARLVTHRRADRTLPFCAERGVILEISRLALRTPGQDIPRELHHQSQWVLEQQWSGHRGATGVRGFEGGRVRGRRSHTSRGFAPYRRNADVVCQRAAPYWICGLGKTGESHRCGTGMGR